MPPLLAAFALLLATAAQQVPGVPPPPEGKFEPELTQVAVERAKAEMTALLAQLDKDTTQPPAVKADVKSKLSRLKVAIYTSGKTMEECVTFYADRVKGSSFLFAERQVLPDLRELAASGRFAVTPKTEEEWGGKSYRYARWVREDGTLSIDVEDHLLDPRDGAVTKRTVVMVTSVGD